MAGAELSTASWRWRRAIEPSVRRPARSCTDPSSGRRGGADHSPGGEPWLSPLRASWPRSRRPRGIQARLDHARDRTRRRDSRDGQLAPYWHDRRERARLRTRPPRLRDQSRLFAARQALQNQKETRPNEGPGGLDLNSRWSTGRLPGGGLRVAPSRIRQLVIAKVGSRQLEPPVHPDAVGPVATQGAGQKRRRRINQPNGHTSSRMLDGEP